MEEERRKPAFKGCKREVILVMGILTLLYAFFMPDREMMLGGFLEIQKSRSYLIHDYIAVGGLAATFFNVGLHYIVAYIIFVVNDVKDLNGLQLAATGIFVGHSFFGSNCINILPIIAGVFAFSRWAGHSPKRFTGVSMLSTACAPVVSMIIFYHDPGFASIFWGCVIGFVLGFFVPPLAEEYIKFSQGFTLYNFGFTTGMLSMIALALFGYFFEEIPSSFLLSDAGAHPYLNIYAAAVILIPLLISLKGGGEIWERYRNLLAASGRLPSDYPGTYGVAVTVFNMALTTLIFYIYLLIVKTPLNGTLLGGLLSIMGFAAFGKNPKSSAIIAAGVLIGARLHGVAFGDSRLLLTMLFSTGLSPVAGYYGLAGGLIAGVLHYNLTGAVFRLHQGLGLYNNGFTSGFVAAILVPVFDTLKRFEGDDETV